jgi:hypothetical protein
MGTQNENEDTVRRIKRGLSSYVSYLAACEMNSTFSEHVLYEPMLRILTSRGYNARCQYALPNENLGANPTIDFVAEHPTHGKLAIEVKWKKVGAIPKLENDFNKLNEYLAVNPEALCLLCVFGRKSHIDDENCNYIGYGFVEFGDPVFVDVAQTRYGCRMFGRKVVELP